MKGQLGANDTIAEVLLQRPQAARVLLDYRMHCVGCAIAPFETVADACEIYGVPLEELLTALNNPSFENEDE